MTSRPFTHTALLAAVLLLSACAHSVNSPAPAAEAADPLVRLQQGNDRFVARPVSAGKPVAARRAQTAGSQHPFAVVVACADSRTAPELVFDQTIGDLFVIRIAGNIVDDYALGSIEYALEHLDTRLVVVLGHERCGAVTAALAGPDAPGFVGSLVRDIQPAVEAARSRGGDPLATAVRTNAEMVGERIKRELHLGPDSPVQVLAAYYDLDSGRVHWTQ